MLLREFKIGNYTLILDQNEYSYVAQIVGLSGEKLFYHEYNDYEKIKASFDEIIQNIQQGKTDIQNILDILEKSTM